MQALIDHAAAVVIGATIILVLAALSMRSQDSTIEALQVDLGKAELRELVDLIEQDFNNMGSGVPFPNRSSATRVIQEFGLGTSADAGYKVFRFQALQDPSGTPTPVSVKYRWRQQGTATLPDGSTINTFEVERSTPSGGTTAFKKVTGFSVSLTDKKFDAVPEGSSTLEDARYVNVEVAMISPLGAEGLLEQTRWSKQFRPMNLNPESIQVVQASCVPSCP